jgi:hypothetical protein
MSRLLQHLNEKAITGKEVEKVIKRGLTDLAKDEKMKRSNLLKDSRILMESFVKSASADEFDKLLVSMEKLLKVHEIGVELVKLGDDVFRKAYK